MDKLEVLSKYIQELDSTESVLLAVRRYVTKERVDELKCLFDEKLILGTNSGDVWDILHEVSKLGSSSLLKSAAQSLELSSYGMLASTFGLQEDVFITAMHRCLGSFDGFMSVSRYAQYQETVQYRIYCVAKKFDDLGFDEALFEAVASSESLREAVLSSSLDLEEIDLRELIKASLSRKKKTHRI